MRPKEDFAAERRWKTTSHVRGLSAFLREWRTADRALVPPRRALPQAPTAAAPRLFRASSPLAAESADAYAHATRPGNGFRRGDTWKLPRRLANVR